MLPSISSLDYYGGPLANYSDVIDPTTDEDAKYRNRYAADASAMSHTVARGAFSFVTASPPTAPVSGFVHDALWGSLSAVKPTAVRASAGIWTLTWPTTVTDPLTASGATAAQGGETAQTLTIRRALAQMESSDGVLRHAVATVTGSNTVRVNTFLANGTADDCLGQIVTVWIY